MGYWDSIMNTELDEGGNPKPTWWEENRLVVFQVIAIIGAFFAGLIVANTSVPYLTHQQQQSVCDSCVRQYEDKFLPQFQAGFLDSYLHIMNEFALNCTPSNVEVFSLQNLDGINTGVMLRCPVGNVTMPLLYSRIGDGE